MNFRYNTTGLWLKGNTHIHSTASDGGKNFSALAELYAAAEYDFLFRTDHWVASDTRQDTAAFPLLWLDGIEMDGCDKTGAYFHVVCLGRVEGVCRTDGLEAGMKAAKEQGAIRIVAHPAWCGNSLEDCRRWEFDGVEVYNHVCHWLNGKSGGLVHWNATLLQNPSTLAFAVDDAHLKPTHPGWNGGWIMVNARKRTRESILNAIWRGNFYSSCGPKFRSIVLNDAQLCVETSPVQFARLVGPKSNGMRCGDFDSEPIQRFSFPIPCEWDYAYLEIEDTEGRRAWTNALFTNDKSSNKPNPGKD
jgi:hypothetical protein